MSNSVDSDQTAEWGVWSGSTLFAFNTWISIKHGNNKNEPDTPYIGNGPVRRVKVVESIRHKVVKLRKVAVGNKEHTNEHNSESRSHYYYESNAFCSIQAHRSPRKFVDIITKTYLFKYTENLTTKKWKISDKKSWYFSYFCSKHRLWVLVRTALSRRF